MISELCFACLATLSYDSSWAISDNSFATASLREKNLVIEVFSKPMNMQFTKTVKAETRNQESSQYFFGLCEMKGKLRPEIFAYGIIDPKLTYSPRIYIAWKIDLKRKLVIPIKTTQLKCINESPDYSG